MKSIEHPAVFNHSIRTFIYARQVNLQQDGLQQNGVPDNDEALFLACLFHDSGTAEDNNGTQRFEVEGADAAGRFLTAEGWTPQLIQPIWEAIALHTSPGIAERSGPLARLTRIGVRIDFGSISLLTDTDLVQKTEQDYARMNIEHVLGSLVVAQAQAQSSKAPVPSWPANLLAAQCNNPQNTETNPAF